MLTQRQILVKRVFDITISLIAIILTSWLIFMAWIVASIETKSNGLFVQERIGRFGKIFKVLKIKTMKNTNKLESTVTIDGDNRITCSGKFFRKMKIDELPQLFNVLFGTMSLVGPRPDVAGFADKLEGTDRIILEVRAGITGPASLKYRHEEMILAKEANPERYNREVIWIDKIEINKAYVENWSLKQDIQYMIQTIIG
ncbi:Undecaprenyl-phosphate galactosephosphotransferase [hydrothermal vent metagenome]|uniref:Undecaprenyl-phosphate galactosephosphotransferase n=1 Tax=hydrothermal vent metagenome TaxID=652676 RepID=A0A1W1BIR7_9ZZZZ